MAKDALSLAILFADIAKSTQIYEALGNDAAKSIIDSCISLFSKVTAHYNGTVVKTIGDEIMCTFPTVDDAIEAAIEMNQSLEHLQFSERSRHGTPNVHIGIQYGPVIKEDGDVFGDAVNLAARMVALAKPRQIVTTEETVRLAPAYRSSARCIDRTTIKGKSGVVGIFEVIWEQQDVTIMEDFGLPVTMDDTMEVREIKTRLELRFQDQVVVIDEDKPSATLGRQIHNDVVIQGSRVSRSHASIEYRWGKFALIDQSSNGTFLTIEGQEPVHLRREEGQLHGTGVIGLGNIVNPDSQTAIHFAIKSSDTDPPDTTSAPETTPPLGGLSSCPTVV